MTIEELVATLEAAGLETSLPGIFGTWELVKLTTVAKEQERERCAQLCEFYAMPDGTSETAIALAAAIRGMK